MMCSAGPLHVRFYQWHQGHRIDPIALCGPCILPAVVRIHRATGKILCVYEWALRKVSVQIDEEFY